MGGTMDESYKTYAIEQSELIKSLQARLEAAKRRIAELEKVLAQTRER